MTEPHDDLDDWLHTQIEPMQPPPGTFQQLRKRARRRKRRQALLSAASAGAVAAVIVLAVVALPKVVPSVLHLHSNPAGHSAAAAPLSSSPRITESGATPFTSRSTPVSKTPSVPPNFQATSVTFANLHTGWVIGQAAVGVAGYCRSGYCTSMARTDNSGKSWYGLHAPLTGQPDGSTGVSQVRFLDTENGWAFGPELFATHDGGATWTQVTVPNGLRVTSLETVGSAEFAVFAQCTGTGQDFAADCTRFFLYSSPAASDDWTPVPGLAGGFSSSAAASSATIVLTHGEGYLYTPDGTLVSGPTTAGATWQAVSPTALPCLPGPAEADGQPSGGQLAASGPGDLALACPPNQAGGTHAGGQAEIIYTSVNGGQSWQPQSSLPTPATVTSLATNTGGVLAVGTSLGVEVSSDNGVNWRLTLPGPRVSYVGLTSPLQGVAVPADTSLHQLWFTFDSGQHWRTSAISSG